MRARSWWAATLVAVVALLAGGCMGGGGSGVEVATVTPVSVESPPPRVGVATAEPRIEPPELIVSVSEVVQGSAILVSLTGSVEEGEVVFLGRRYPLTQGDLSKYTYLGIGIFDTPGTHTMHVLFTLVNGSEGSFQHEITVSESEWDIAYISYVEGAGDPVLDPGERDREGSLLAETYAQVTPEKLWSGRWRVPVQGGSQASSASAVRSTTGPWAAITGALISAPPRARP